MRKLTAFVLFSACVMGLAACFLGGCAGKPLNDVNAADAGVILEKPPVLSVVSDETVMDALLGSYSWQKRNADGTSVSVEADSAHPLDCQDLLSPLETTDISAALDFTKEPDAILSVRCWSDEHWSDLDAESEEVTVDGNVMELKKGGYIYEVIAQWGAESGYGGTAHYYVYIKTI